MNGVVAICDTEIDRNFRQVHIMYNASTCPQKFNASYAYGPLNKIHWFSEHRYQENPLHEHILMKSTTVSNEIQSLLRIRLQRASIKLFLQNIYNMKGTKHSLQKENLELFEKEQIKSLLDEYAVARAKIFVDNLYRKCERMDVD